MAMKRGTGIDQVRFTSDDPAGTPTWTTLPGEYGENATMPEVQTEFDTNSRKEQLPGQKFIDFLFEIMQASATEIDSLRALEEAGTRTWFEFTGSSGDMVQTVGGTRGCFIKRVDPKGVPEAGVYARVVVAANVRGATESDVMTMTVS